jgi:hypothetical protein
MRKKTRGTTSHRTTRSVRKLSTIQFSDDKEDPDTSRRITTSGAAVMPLGREAAISLLRGLVHNADFARHGRQWNRYTANT